MRRTLVDVGAVGLLSGLGALLLLAGWGGGLLAGLLLLGRCLASWCLAGGGWGLQACQMRNATSDGASDAKVPSEQQLLVPF